MREETANRLGMKPLARVLGMADGACEAKRFAVAPAVAIPKALKAAGLEKGEIDVWEINEAFAAVVLANIKVGCVLI